MRMAFLCASCASLSKVPEFMKTRVEELEELERKKDLRERIRVAMLEESDTSSVSTQPSPLEYQLRYANAARAANPAEVEVNQRPTTSVRRVRTPARGPQYRNPVRKTLGVRMPRRRYSKKHSGSITKTKKAVPIGNHGAAEASSSSGPKHTQESDAKWDNVLRNRIAKLTIHD